MTRQQFERNLLAAKVELLEDAFWDLIAETIRHDNSDMATFVLINGVRLTGDRKEERERRSTIICGTILLPLTKGYIG